MMGRHRKFWSELTNLHKHTILKRNMVYCGCGEIMFYSGVKANKYFWYCRECYSVSDPVTLRAVGRLWDAGKPFVYGSTRAAAEDLNKMLRPNASVCGGSI